MADTSSKTVYHADIHGCSALNARTVRLFADAREGRIRLLLEGLEEGARLTRDHCFNGYCPSTADVASRHIAGLEQAGHFVRTSRARLVNAALAYLEAERGWCTREAARRTARQMGAAAGTAVVLAYLHCHVGGHARHATALEDMGDAARDVGRFARCASAVELLAALEGRVPGAASLLSMLDDVEFAWDDVPGEVERMNRALFAEREAAMARNIARERCAHPEQDVHVLVGVAHVCPAALPLARRLFDSDQLAIFLAHQVRLCAPRLLDHAPGTVAPLPGGRAAH